MKHIMIAVTAVGVMLSANVFADVRIENKDSQAYDLSSQCAGSGLSRVSANTDSSLGTGPCTVTVKATGSTATAQDGGKLVIQNGQISSQ